MAKQAFTLICIETARDTAPARLMHNKEITLQFLPRVGDYIFDPTWGYAEVVRIIFSTVASHPIKIVIQ